ncbi:hypothetical protein [Erythrobacter sp.]|uniref:hypothetical protein n=1 Tax=Erythrobacter sp. TaxID=1042 RepID=UPI003C7619C1
MGVEADHPTFLEVMIQATDYGKNGFYIRPYSMVLVGALYQENKVKSQPVPLEILDFSQGQRELRASSRKHVDRALANVGASVRGWQPRSLLVGTSEGWRAFYIAEMGVHGTLCLAFTEEHVFGSHEDAFSALPTLRNKCWAMLGDRTNYWKWNPEFELERKFTFDSDIDTWWLINELYQSICFGELSGFVPETDMDFQVFDYESILFDVPTSDDRAGYISFIPQADGLVATKRKWFQANAELRKESVDWNQSIDLDQLDEVARKLSDGPARKLATFRRKRLDVNFESLETGHIFGVYFDICRAVDGSVGWMSQCEVEYCRTRTLIGLEDVMEEYEIACNFTEEFLNQRGVAYEQNLYSKLDFARECRGGSGETP